MNDDVWNGDTNRMPKKYIDESKDTPKEFDGTPFVSDRTFGVELEMFEGDDKTMKAFCNANGHGYESDGSIRDNNGNHGGREIVSKVFSGKKGAVELLALTDKAKELGYKCNYSTGTHIHLGAKDFYTADSFKQHKISELSKLGNNDILLVETLLLNKMKRSLRLETIVNRYFVDGFLSFTQKGTFMSSYVMEDGKTSYVTIVPCTYLGNRYLILCRVSTLQEQMGLKPQAVANGRQMLKITDVTTNISRDNYGKEFATLGVGKISVFSKASNSLWHDLKTLFAFYVYFDDVFFGMLPPSRKNSIYSVPLRENYLLSHVMKCENQSDIEKVWYGSNDLERIEDMKEERKHISRRSAINLHSIFNRHCTLEVRSHHGTTNGQSILGWVALHQRVMDSIKARLFTAGDIGQFPKKLSLSEKAHVMCEILGIDGELLNFVKNRLQIHSNIKL